MRKAVCSVVVGVMCKNVQVGKYGTAYIRSTSILS